MHLFNEVTDWDLEEFPLDDIDSVETFLHRCKNLPHVSLFFDLDNPTIEGLVAGFGLNTESIPLTDDKYNKVLVFYISGLKPEGHDKLVTEDIEDDSDNILGIWPLYLDNHANPFNVKSVAERILEVRNKIKAQEYKITLKSEYHTHNGKSITSHTYSLKLL